ELQRLAIMAFRILAAALIEKHSTVTLMSGCKSLLINRPARAVAGQANPVGNRYFVIRLCLREAAAIAQEAGQIAMTTCEIMLVAGIVRMICRQLGKNCPSVPEGFLCLFSVPQRFRSN